jgi:GNAT superfamily N-acetyltransferase
MPRLTVRPFEPGDLDPAARLLAARHRRHRDRLPMLSAALESPGSAARLVSALMTSPRASGAVAVAGGDVAGFLFGEQLLFPDTELASLYLPPHSISMPVEGHAVAAGQDATTVYRALYAHLATDWVAAGFFTHRAHIVPGEADVQEAWVSLGFGRHTTCGTRDTGPVANARPANIEVHQASQEDIDVVLKLAHTLNLHHVQSPMFWPYLHTTDQAAREFNLNALADPANPYFVAYQDGKPAGMQTFLLSGFTPPIVEREKNIYLYEGVMEPEARSAGAGSALLDYTMRWAREHGYDWCTLHFASGNWSGAPFWLGHGFTPVEYTMQRHVDERIAWARE